MTVTLRMSGRYEATQLRAAVLGPRGDERWVDDTYINQALFDEGLAMLVNE